MKRKLIGISIALVAMSSCLALAQDRDHDRDNQHHRHHTSHHRVYVTTNTHYRSYRGGHQSITYYTYHNLPGHRQRTGSRRMMTWYQKNPARPWYHPKSPYTKSEWEARMRAARARRHHRNYTTTVIRTGHQKHHTSWVDAVIRNGHRRHHRHHRRAVTFERRHDNGLHRGWYIGRGNPHRIGWKHRGGDRNDRGHGDRDHDRDTDHGRGKGHGHGHEMAFVNSGFQLASWQQYGDQDYGYQHRNDQHRNNKRRGSSHSRFNRRYYAAGHYTSTTRWSRRGQEFVIQYVINLSSAGHARLEATSLQDRNMPNNEANTDPHGEILRYMHTGHDVIQTGSWRQDGNDVTIHLTDIRYGHTLRSKSETLRAHLAGNTLVVDSYDSNFYGDRFDPTFRKD